MSLPRISSIAVRERFSSDKETPVPSDAATDMIERAMTSDTDDPLYVVAVGAITNVASAILIEPEIINRIVIIWLGGNPLYWPHTREFNLMQDLYSAQVVWNAVCHSFGYPHVGSSHIYTRRLLRWNAMCRVEAESVIISSRSSKITPVTTLLGQR